ncbi:hypothetical protein, partial [Acinetobacter pittii]|uniref:hypothetical protein n=1 Tax=Acinetobacter pittii TaxID=48296 RepID=UPI001BC86C2D
MTSTLRLVRCPAFSPRSCFTVSTDSIAERVKQVRLSLSGTDFDRKKDYFLVLKDKDLNIEMQR